MNLGILLLGIWFIVRNLLPLLEVNFPNQGMIYGLAATGLGLLLVLGGGSRPQAGAGYRLVGVYMLLFGLVWFITQHYPAYQLIVNVLGLVAGVAVLVVGPARDRRLLGTLLLAIWLLVSCGLNLLAQQGILQLGNAFIPTALAILGIAAGVMLLVRK